METIWELTWLGVVFFKIYFQVGKLLKETRKKFDESDMVMWKGKEAIFFQGQRNGSVGGSPQFTTGCLLTEVITDPKG